MRGRLEDLALGALAVLTVLLLALVVGREQVFPDGAPGERAPSTSPDENGPTTGSTGRKRQDDARSAGPSQDPTPNGPPKQHDRAFRVADTRGGVLIHGLSRRCRPNAGSAVLQVLTRTGSVRRTVPGMSTITGVQVIDPLSLRVVGGDARCAAVAMRSSDQGQTWQPAEEFGFWSMVPDEQSGLVHPTGRTSLPCAPVSVSGVGEGAARVLCGSARILGTADNGDTWGSLGLLPFGITTGYASPALGYALVHDDDCEGPLLRRTLDGGASWKDVDCAGLDGPWAIIARGSEVLLVGADGVRRSTDRGRTWE